jgi:hypothetical protein
MSPQPKPEPKPEPKPGPLSPTEEPDAQDPHHRRQPEPDQKVRRGSSKRQSREQVVFDEDKVAK